MYQGFAWYTIWSLHEWKSKINFWQILWQWGILFMDVSLRIQNLQMDWIEQLFFILRTRWICCRLWWEIWTLCGKLIDSWKYQCVRYILECYTNRQQWFWNWSFGNMGVKRMIYLIQKPALMNLNNKSINVWSFFSIPA